MKQEELKRWFDYDKNTGVISRKNKTLGFITSYGYRRVYYKNKNHYAHRLAWIIANGDIPESMQIDHINGDRLDNRIVNLRLVTHKENHKNKKKNTKNTSGFIGVDYKTERDKWRACITVNNEYVFLGYFDTLEDAVEARQEASVSYGFHTNHGR